MPEQDTEYTLEELLSKVTEHNRQAEVGWDMHTAPETEASVRERITSFLDGLSVESLSVVEQLLKLLHDNGRSQTHYKSSDNGGAYKAFQYPTVAMPASSLSGWIGLLREGYPGDALEDSEALYSGD